MRRGRLALRGLGKRANARAMSCGRKVLSIGVACVSAISARE
jgi:hypothetical protein